MTIVDHLSGLLNSIQRDVYEVLKYHRSLNNGGGIHSVPRQVFCFIDHVASIRYKHEPGKETDWAVKFIREYFGTLNQRYRDYGGLLYDIWRHGTVHEYDPQIVVIEDSGERRLGWVVSDNDGNGSRACHLLCGCFETKSQSYGFILNLFEMVEHLMQVVENLRRELEKNPTLREQCETNYQSISQPNPLPGGSLLTEARRFISSATVVLDSSGNVLRDI